MRKDKYLIICKILFEKIVEEVIRFFYRVSWKRCHRVLGIN